jgi:hypothetical protein
VGGARDVGMNGEDSVENDNIENDSIENDNIEDDSIENDNIENDSIEEELQDVEVKDVEVKDVEVKDVEVNSMRDIGVNPMQAVDVNPMQNIDEEVKEPNDIEKVEDIVKKVKDIQKVEDDIQKVEDIVKKVNATAEPTNMEAPTNMEKELHDTLITKLDQSLSAIANRPELGLKEVSQDAIALGMLLMRLLREIVWGKGGEVKNIVEEEGFLFARDMKGEDISRINEFKSIEESMDYRVVEAYVKTVAEVEAQQLELYRKWEKNGEKE